jgi:hypothetical protein
MQMSPREKRLDFAKSATVVATALFASLGPAVAFAQETAAPAPAPKLAAVTTTTTQEPAAPSNVVTQTEPPPPAVEDASSKPLSTAVWGRIGNYIQGTDPTKLDDVSQDAEVDILLSGQIHKFVAWQADFVGYFGGDQTGNAEILDLIGKLELHKTFNLWVGRMLVPSDRSNFSGPWFMAPWNYPGFYPGLGAPAGPRQGKFGRNDGATVWGDFGEGTFKYYLGAFDLRNRSDSPLYTARINLSLLSPEPGYYNSSTYYGMDILAIGFGAQYKKGGSLAPAPMPGAMAIAPDDYSGFNVDVLFEKKLGTAGAFDLEGAFYVFNGDNEILENHFYALASYLIPAKLGFGQIQPLFRFQGASPKAGGDMWQLYDAQIGYVISQYAARVAIGYQSGTVGAAKSNAVFMGLQLQK